MPVGEKVTVRIAPGVIAIEDQGPGVPPELRSRTFAPFARGR
ncbi:MAG: sensor histidine kinase, partial [Myxococcales bacterium]|nr:sensor histidine kinase [Myxococcales bacterium]